MSRFQESRNSTRYFRFVEVVILTDGGLCRCQIKLTTARAVPPVHLYVPYSTDGTLGLLSYCPRSGYSLGSSSRGRDPSVWWNFLVFSFGVICSNGTFWLVFLQLHHWGYGWQMRCHHLLFSLGYIFPFEPSNAHLLDLSYFVRDCQKILS